MKVLMLDVWELDMKLSVNRLPMLFFCILISLFTCDYVVG